MFFNVKWWDFQP